MQLKYNRQQGAVSSILKTLFKLFFIIIVFIIGIFRIEKIEFPSPKKNYNIEITDEIKKLK